MLNRSERVADFLAGLLTAIVLLILYAPVFISAIFSLVEVNDGRILWETASIRNYISLWSNPSVIDALANTAIVAVCAVTISTVLAIALALYAEWPGAMFRRGLETAIYLPFLLPPIVTGLSLLVTSAQLGINRGLATIVMGHSAFVLAVAYRLVLTRLQSMPKTLVEASYDLGATRLQTFRYITLPFLASAITTGAVLALTLSFDETLISVFLAGDRMTLPLRLWAMMRVGFSPEINALVTLVLLVSLILAATVASRLKIGSSNQE